MKKRKGVQDDDAHTALPSKPPVMVERDEKFSLNHAFHNNLTSRSPNLLPPATEYPRP